MDVSVVDSVEDSTGVFLLAPDILIVWDFSWSLEDILSLQFLLPPTVGSSGPQVGSSISSSLKAGLP